MMELEGGFTFLVPNPVFLLAPLPLRWGASPQLFASQLPYFHTVHVFHILHRAVLRSQLHRAVVLKEWSSPDQHQEHLRNADFQAHLKAESENLGVGPPIRVLAEPPGDSDVPSELPKICVG